jgi:hypothetical protein
MSRAPGWRRVDPMSIGGVEMARRAHGWAARLVVVGVVAAGSGMLAAGVGAADAAPAGARSGGTITQVTDSPPEETEANGNGR